MNKQLLETFITLAKIDSPTGEEDKIIDFLYFLLKDWNVKYYKDKFGNLIVSLKGVGEPLLLSAHVDTVEPGRGIKPIIKNNEIKSDGTTIIGADNKVALACLLELIKNIQEHKVSNRSLEIVFTKSEESGNYGAINLDYGKISSKTGYIFDNATPVGTIITASPFYDRIDLKITGKASHASRPTEGINVLSIFKNALEKIKLGNVTSKTIVNIGFAQAGDARNTVPGVLNLKAEVRSFSEAEINKYSKEFAAVFKAEAKKLKGKVEISVVRENPGYEYATNDLLIKETINKMNNVKIKASLNKNYGCSDANIFVGHGIQIINLGNGATGTHTREESMTFVNFELLNKLIVSLATVK